jgi:hypothetical protein
MKSMGPKKNTVKAYSIHDYLNLDIYSWFVEFDVRDFGASLSSLLELPLPIYLSQARDFFWKFLSKFAVNCSIAFILRNDQDSVDLALLGIWDDRQLAIPLWIVNDTLIGFEIITSLDFSVLDSSPLKFESPFDQFTTIRLHEEFYTLNSDVSISSVLHFRISDNCIHLSDYQQDYDLAFFEKIASTSIPELDKTDDSPSN